MNGTDTFIALSVGICVISAILTAVLMKAKPVSRDSIQAPAE